MRSIPQPRSFDHEIKSIKLYFMFGPWDAIAGGWAGWVLFDHGIGGRVSASSNRKGSFKANKKR